MKGRVDKQRTSHFLNRRSDHMIFSESIFKEKAQKVGSEIGGANESGADVELRDGELRHEVQI